MLDKKLIYAIVGASNDSKKYGNKVMKDLDSKKFKIIPINPHEKEILGHKVYPTILDIPVKIDFVIFIVPPKITEKVLLEVKKLDIKNVWMQPGSESETAIKFCEENKIAVIHHACIMLK